MQGSDDALDQVGIYVPTQVSTLVYSLVCVYYGNLPLYCVWLHYRNREQPLEHYMKYLK